MRMVFSGLSLSLRNLPGIVGVTRISRLMQRDPASPASYFKWLLWSPQDRNGWRPHIDGLRAVSVLAVVFYHTNADKIPGGFVGVDVFFVISGFLISRVIYDDIAAHGSFRVVKFYERRARRILPAFFVITAATIVAGYFLFLPDEFAALGRSALYASGFAANIYFYDYTSGYFGASSTTMPLLHYWSLGVEEQFYIAFPLIVLAVSKLAPRALGIAILLIGGSSCVLAEVYLRTAPAAAFYLTPPRAWELIVGCILTLPYFPSTKRRLIREFATSAGIALIFFALFTYSDSTPFPGITAAVPVMGAALILWGCEAGSTVVGTLLSLTPLRLVGLWSYSIYMVHWPLIVFARVIWPFEGTYVDSAIVGASILLGFLSYLFVETPFRRGTLFLSRPILFGASLASLLVVAGSGLVAASTDGFPDRLPEPVRQMLAYNHYDYMDVYRKGSCFLGGTDFWKDLKPECLPPGHPSALLWGDSCAAHYYAALKDRFPGFVILQANMTACHPIVGVEQFIVPECKAFNDAALEWTLTNRPDIIILSSAWPIDPAPWPRLDEMIARLRSAKLPVIIIGQTPTFIDTVPNILARRLLRGDPDTRAENEGKGGPFWGDYYMKDRYSGLDGVEYISSRDSFCQDRDCPLVTPAGVPVYWDSGHLTRDGADLVVRHMFSKGLEVKKSQ